MKSSLFISGEASSDLSSKYVLIIEMILFIYYLEELDMQAQVRIIFLVSFCEKHVG